MKNLVVDASLAGAWLLKDEASVNADQLLAQVEAGQVALNLPSLWLYEMANLLFMAVRRQRLAADQLDEHMSFLARVPKNIFEPAETIHLQRIARLAQRFGLTAYDAAYLELADRLQCPLRTQDKKLAVAAKDLGLG